MDLLERAIRLALEMEDERPNKIIFASATFKAREIGDSYQRENRTTMHYEASFLPKTNGFVAPCKPNPNHHNIENDTETPQSMSTKKAARYSKPEYVYWFQNEVEKW